MWYSCPHCFCRPHLDLTMTPPRRLRATGLSTCALVLFSGCCNSTAAVVVNSSVRLTAPAYVVSSKTFNEASPGHAAPHVSAAAEAAPRLPLVARRSTEYSHRPTTERCNGRSQKLVLFASSSVGALSSLGRGCLRPAGTSPSCFATARPSMSKVVSC